MEDEHRQLIDEGDDLRTYGTSLQQASRRRKSGSYQYNDPQHSGKTIRRQQRRIVFCIGMLVLAVFSTTMIWGLPFVLANLPARADVEVKPPPSASKQGVYNRGAVSADSTYCPPIGRAVLEQGGSAVDAAVAMLLCQGVTDPHRSGIGGGMYMVVYQRKNRTAVTVDARETAPFRAHRHMFDGDRSKTTKGGLAVAVPGELLGLWEAHKQFGSLPWSSLVQPSIKMCEDGVEVSQHLALYLTKYRHLISADPVLRETYTSKETGEVLKAGEVLKNPKLGNTLRTVAEQGPCPLYKGHLAEALAQDVRKAGGILRMSDLKLYKTRWMEAVSNKVNAEGQELQMFTSPPPSGGVVLAHILNILEGFHLSPEDDKTVSNQVLTLHRVVEAFKYAYAKRSLMGDPMYTDISQVVDELLSKESAENVRKNIDDYKTMNNISSYGNVHTQTQDSGTTHVCVVAPNGDAVSATSTINFNFGSGVMSNSTGILLNNEMDDFNLPNDTSWGTLPSNSNLISAGKRPLSSMTPAIFVNRSGDVRLVVGGAGGIRIITSVALVTIRNLWLGNSVKEAIDARRVHHQLVPNVLEYEYGLLNQVIDALKSRYHAMKQVEYWPAHVTAIERKPNGTLVANSDFRKGGTVDGID